MCNYVPGEAVAFGRMPELHEYGNIEVSGNISIEPICMVSKSHDIEILDDSFHDFGFMRVSDIPFGLEAEVISKLSASFSDGVKNGNVIVDFNYYMPHSMPKFTAPKDIRLSRPARKWAKLIRNYHNDIPLAYTAPIAIIDSGVNKSNFRGRQIHSLDFSNGKDGEENTQSEDIRGHGTRVATILHEALPYHIPLVSAKIGDRNDEVTVLNVARAFAHTVTVHSPAVINISLAPLDDTYTCPNCAEEVKIPAFHSRILRRIISLAKNTLVVMASGNSQQPCNERHLDTYTSNLVFAVALGSDLNTTEYSSFPIGPDSSQFTAYAFGGDDPGNETGEGVFASDRNSYGTSFAAPFISAATYSRVIRRRQENETIERRRIFGPNHHQFGYGGWLPDIIEDYRRRHINIL